MKHFIKEILAIAVLLVICHLIDIANILFDYRFVLGLVIFRLWYAPIRRFIFKLF